MTARVEKRYSAGLVLNTFYTFQKTLTENEGETGAGGVDYYNRRLEKGLASATTSSTGSSMSCLTSYRSAKAGVDERVDLRIRLFGGWELTWTQTLQSGLPFTVGIRAARTAICPPPPSGRTSSRRTIRRRSRIGRSVRIGSPPPRRTHT